MKIYPKAGTFEGAQYYSLLALSEEVGELHGKMAKSYRDGTSVGMNDIIKELGDIMFQWVAVCTDMDLDPNDVVETNVKKLIDRKDRHVIEGSGDDR